MIKLDVGLVQNRPTVDTAEIVSAVAAESERTGATVIAEGIETEANLLTALALGATLAQGFLFGRPSPELAPEPGAWPIIRGARLDPELEGRTPFELVSAVRPTRVATKPLLLEISRLLEARALVPGRYAVVVSAFQDARFFTARERRHYVELARAAAFVGILGAGIDPSPGPGLRGGTLRDDDPVLGEWAVAVIGAHFAACLVGLDLGDEGPDEDRRFRFVFTHDRDLAVACATSLMRRITPLGD